MTANRDFKRLVRARMQKTGEAYTSARANLVLQPSVPPSPRPTVPPDYAALAGLSDASVKKATGCKWDSWVKALDKVEAHTWTHREIVQYAHEKFKTPDWWAQMVVVGYERIKGLRAIGERRGGGVHEVTKSKVFPVPLGRLFGAWSNPRTRARWLPGVKVTVRTAQPNKSIRLTWPDGTIVAAGFTAKGTGKSQVALAHQKLKDKADATARRSFWAERLAALGEMLA